MTAKRRFVPLQAIDVRPQGTSQLRQVHVFLDMRPPIAGKIDYYHAA